MGTDHFVNYDNIRAKLEEGAVRPGRAVRLFFPLADDVNDYDYDATGKPSLTPGANAYLRTQFANEVTDKMLKYKGMHFTICVFSPTSIANPDELPAVLTGHADWNQPRAENGTAAQRTWGE